jgi:hypothetical protein
MGKSSKKIVPQPATLFLIIITLALFTVVKVFVAMLSNFLLVYPDNGNTKGEAPHHANRLG